MPEKDGAAACPGECEVILKRFLPTEVYINWRFTKAYEQNFVVATFYCLARC